MSVEIRSLNGRYFDLSVRLPRQMQALESLARERAQAALVRGKISLSAELSHAQGAQGPLRLNLERVQEYRTMFERLKEALELNEELTLAHYTAFDDLFVVEPPQEGEQVAELFEQALEEALAKVTQMRAAEGAQLIADISRRVSAFGEQLGRLESAAEDHREGDLERLRGRVRELAAGVDLDEGRLLQEVALLAEKRDVTEEFTRLRSHLSLFETYLSFNGEAGKQMGFLLQEMGREVNTIGSKTDHLEVSHGVVRLKHELEKIREQAQNIL